MVHDQLLIFPAQDEVDADPMSEADFITERKNKISLGWNLEHDLQVNH